MKAEIVHTTRVHVLGIDLAKNSFSLHGVNAHGKCVLSKSLSRAKLVVCVAQVPPCWSAWMPAPAPITRPVCSPAWGTPCASWCKSPLNSIHA